MPPDETMDVEEQVECLNKALRLQHRSVLLYSLTAGSVIGPEYRAHRIRPALRTTAAPSWRR